MYAILIAGIVEKICDYSYTYVLIFHEVINNLYTCTGLEHSDSPLYQVPSHENLQGIENLSSSQLLYTQQHNKLSYFNT